MPVAFLLATGIICGFGPSQTVRRASLGGGARSPHLEFGLSFCILDQPDLIKLII
jgi:hypothetical protein